MPVPDQERYRSRGQGNQHNPRGGVQSESCENLKNFINESQGKLSKLFKDAEKIDKLWKLIDTFVSENLKKAETSSIRKFYDKVKELERRSLRQSDSINIRRELIMLKPVLFYSTARKSELKPLSEVLFTAIDNVQDVEDFKYFVEIFQAIVAYHKYHFPRG